MRSLLSHSYIFKSGNSEYRILSLFIVAQDMNAQELDAEVVEVLSSLADNIEFVHIVGYGECIAKVREQLKDTHGALRGRLEARIGTIAERLRLISFDAQLGDYSLTDGQGQPIPESRSVLESERNEVLLCAFMAGGGEQRAPIGTHFVKTSTSHADRFLRVSNVLEEGGNLCLIAFWLIKYIWKKPFRYIGVDTSGI